MMEWLRGKLKRFLYRFSEGTLSIQKKGNVLEVTVVSGWDSISIQVPQADAEKLSSWMRQQYPTTRESASVKTNRSTAKLSLLKPTRDPGPGPQNTKR